MQLFPLCIGTTHLAPTNQQCLRCNRYGQRCDWKGSKQVSITLHHGSFDNWFVLGDERMRRINGADIEGDRGEWEQVAAAIERGESISFKRCAAVRQQDGTWHLSSPRNSVSATIVNAKEASWIAAEIRRVLAATAIDVPQPSEYE